MSRITVALLAWTAWMTIFAVPVRAAPWRGGDPRWHGDIGRFHEHDFSCGTAVVGYMGGTPVGSAGGGLFPEDGTSIRLPSIPIQIRMFLRL